MDGKLSMPLPALVNRRVVAFIQGLAFNRLALSFPDHVNWTDLTAAIREEDICINPPHAGNIIERKITVRYR